ncbi:MAG TPA: hypothetical protein VGK89_01475 [Candidatus Eisenbacteria bacterium]|jgi:hypothetical protein
MKRVLGLLVLVGALAFAVAVHASDTKAAKGASKPMTLKGELVDMGCYVSHGAMGEKHKDCATKCVAGGMPMGLLTSDNKLYVLTLNHDNPDPFNKAKEMMAAMVEVTGMVSERGGTRIIDVTDLKAAATASK